MEQDGIVFNFNPLSGRRFTIGDDEYGVQTANRDWSLTNPAPDTLRFELRSGDKWQHDPANKERAELNGKSFFGSGEDISIDYSLMVEPGAPNTATGGGFTGKWMTLGQLHAADGNGTSIFCFELIGEKLAVRIGYREADNSWASKYVFIDDADFSRGVYHDIEVDFRMGGAGTGFLDIRLDGELIVDYDGALGYGYAAYWKPGLYRSNAAETIAANYKGMDSDGNQDIQVYGTEANNTITPKKVPVGEAKLTNTGDVIFGMEGNDTITAGGGDDLVFGGDGNDTLKGMNGADALLAEAGDDMLVGGGGGDYFHFSPGGGKDTIKDFAKGDHIVFDKPVFDAYDQVEAAMVKQKKATLIVYDGGSVLVKAFTPDKLDSGDFLFV